MSEEVLDVGFAQFPRMAKLAVLLFDELIKLVVVLDVGLLCVIRKPNSPNLPAQLLFEFHNIPMGMLLRLQPEIPAPWNKIAYCAGLAPVN